MNGMIKPVIVPHNDRIKVIDELMRNEDENHFLLTYMHGLVFERDYTLIKYGSSYVLNIKNLILSISYSVEPPKGLKEYISDMNARMVIAPGVENIRELEHIAADEKKRESLMAIRRDSIESCYENTVRNDYRTYKELISFYNSIKEYRGFYSTEDMKKKQKSHDDSHFASSLTDEDGIVSALFVNSGLLASVATREDKRERGYATRNIISALSYYFENNKAEKKAYLFYNDEKAEKLYKRIGFYNVCPFLILKRRCI